MPISRNRAAAPPKRLIATPTDLALFQSSPTYSLLRSFILDLNHAVLNKPTSSEIPEPPIITGLIEMVKRAEVLVEKFPPKEEGGNRFGNESFREWYDAVSEEAEVWEMECLGMEGWPEGAVQETAAYFKEAFGNRTRIDYGSGHELNFIAWLLCLQQLGLIPPDAYPALVLRVFTHYLTLMRRLQTTYYLEPAGSHGVWGLDDYQFLPFLFGSSQLYSHPHIRPKSIHDSDILSTYSPDYLYLSCISFINSIKTTAGLRWHSPMLDDISAAKNWGKINEGMVKMWEKEVLGKLPVVQHFMFGGVLRGMEGMGEAGEVMGVHGKGCVGETWGDCCGIKVPASVAARREAEGKELRRIPFD